MTVLAAAKSFKCLTSRFLIQSKDVALYRSGHSNASEHLKSILREELNNIKAAGTWKEERIITSSQSTLISVAGQNTKILNFCANNYLGLSNHPEVVHAAKTALEKYGAGLSSVRFICGTQSIHKELEKKIADFHCKEDTILYPSCFDANGGFFESVLTPKDAVLSDELNHASIIDGIRLCKAQKFRYKHRDMADLEEHLKKVSDARLKVIATDGVFSMDGNVAPLPDICKLAQKYGALTFVDECHATGFFGKTGRGTEEFYGMMGAIDIITSTLGKAVGGAAGGYTTGPKELIDILRQRSRPYLFSNSMPPAVVGAAIKALDLLINDSSFTERIQKNTERFRSAMTKAGFTIAGENHPICPVMLGDAKLATIFAEQMLSRGIYVIGFSYPVVPKDKARIRVQISAAHTKDEIDKAVNAFVDIGKKLNVIK
ncbi:2-amino-3-ketobutyrate coenzyme A ligase, mitochondrial [Schistocerca cancellata]|uniref:2-amino-3-ketobutyrate coenzyme A ligase, mitochondrial n=1 Tax=Schistocerca cancellata TaxID=274614 RepID=UPI002117DE65|nr:2-amino-3-ketobutyrate coenzyme A ligase, mitochondrial [Schistocerca cancellata]